MKCKRFTVNNSFSNCPTLGTTGSSGSKVEAWINYGVVSIESKSKRSERGSESRSFGKSVELKISVRERFDSARSPGPEFQFPNAAASVLVFSRLYAGARRFRGMAFETEGAPRERLDHSRPGRRPRTIRPPFTCATVACVPCYRS